MQLHSQGPFPVGQKDQQEMEFVISGFLLLGAGTAPRGHPKSPSGPVTIPFADIQDSASLKNLVTDAWRCLELQDPWGGLSMAPLF